VRIDYRIAELAERYREEALSSEHGRTMEAMAHDLEEALVDSTWINRTPWRNGRLLFNTWRAPFPSLFHRWDVLCVNGWCGGFFWYRSAVNWIREYDSLPGNLVLDPEEAPQ
jgi:hypothetical protein